MPRTIVDIPEDDLQFLAELCRREKISRAEAVRRAVRELKVRTPMQRETEKERTARILRETQGA